MPMWVFLPLALFCLFCIVLGLDTPSGWAASVIITGLLLLLCLGEAGVLT